MNDLKIIDALGKEEVLAQLAEEATELAQAALKLRRAMNGRNPTPIKESEALDNLVEELADVALCAEIFFDVEDKSEGSQGDLDTVDDAIVDIVQQKYDRWIQRLQKVEGEEE